MKTRILTAIVGIPVVLGCIFGPLPLIYLFAAVMMLVLNDELAKMQKEKLKPLFHQLSMVNAVVALGCYVFLTKDLAFIFAILNVLFMAEVVFAYPRIELHEAALLALSTIYATWLPLHMIALRSMDYGAWMLMCVFIMVWVCDSCAYFTGMGIYKTIGKKFRTKHRMAPNLSPNKTIEGAIGGITGTIIAAIIVERFLPIEMSLLLTVLLGLMVAVGAIVGDLFESYLKRSFDVKDSGKILPGHGGFADRFDSFLLVAPLCYYFFSMMIV